MYNTYHIFDILTITEALRASVEYVLVILYSLHLNKYVLKIGWLMVIHNLKGPGIVNLH